jgi:hypothetical protein
MGKRGPECTVCTHERRHQIDIGLVHHVPATILAKRFGCSPDAILRHAKAHRNRSGSPTDVRNRRVAGTACRATGASAPARRACFGAWRRPRLRFRRIGDHVQFEVGRTTTWSIDHGARRPPSQHVGVAGLSAGNERPRIAAIPDAARAVGAALHAMEAEAAADITARATPPVMIEARPALPPCPVPPC